MQMCVLNKYTHLLGLKFHTLKNLHYFIQVSSTKSTKSFTAMEVQEGALFPDS